MLIIYQEEFSTMLAYKRLTDKPSERKRLKRQLKASFVYALGDSWKTFPERTQAVYDEIIYKATDRGFSFNGIETLMEKCEVSRSTVSRVLQRLKETGLVFVAYRKNTNGRGAKTPVIFLKEHPHFEYWKELLDIQDEIVSDIVSNEQNPSETRDEEAKSDPYHSLPSNNFLKDDYKDIFIRQLKENGKKWVDTVFSYTYTMFNKFKNTIMYPFAYFSDAYSKNLANYENGKSFILEEIKKDKKAKRSKNKKPKNTYKPYRNSRVAAVPKWLQEKLDQEEKAKKDKVQHKEQQYQNKKETWNEERAEKLKAYLLSI